MRFGGFQFALLALALSACADSDKPIAGFDTITVEIPPQTTTQAPRATPTPPQIGKVEPAVAPAPRRKPARTAVAKARSQPKPQAPREVRRAPERKELAREELPRKQPAREANASMTLTPEDAVLRPEPVSEPQSEPEATKPVQPAMVQEDSQGRTTITPRTPRKSASAAPAAGPRQSTICRDAPQAVCKELAECAWVDTYTIGPGVYVDGYCESR